MNDKMIQTPYGKKRMSFLVRAMDAHTHLDSLCNIALMISSRHHAGTPISNELWSDLYQYAREARALLQH